MLIPFFRKHRDDIALLTLRLALGSVFVWFGIDKWVHPDDWFVWLPSTLRESLPFGVDDLVVLTGLVEFAIGLALISGTYVRESAALAGVSLLTTVIAFGPAQATVQTSGLMALAIALFIDENSRAKKYRVPDKVITWVVAGLILFMFIFGVSFLRAD